MVISKRSKYALKALSLLTREHGSGPLQIAEIATKERIPKKFLEAILLVLKNRGVLDSRKGKGGGYLLLRSPAQVTVGSILRIFEGSLAPVPCVEGAPARKCPECRDAASCGTRLVMQDAYAAASSVLDSVTLADMVEREENARRLKKEVLMYDI